jgi:DNA repair protein RadD
MYRPYQKQAIESVFDYFKANPSGHPLICAPTGSGKSHILAGICAETLARYPKESILVVTHTREIIAQNAKAIRKYVPYDKVGVYSVGLKHKEIKQFTVAGIQSIHKKAELFSHVKLIIVDEAHLIPPTGEGRYLTFFKDMPQARILGLTATPFRRAHGLLTENHIFDKVIYDIPIRTLIKQKHLVPLSSKTTDFAMDTSNLKVIAGDYSKADLSNRLDRQDVTTAIVQELVAFKEKYKAWLVFAIDIEHCEHITKQLNAVDISAAAVHSKLDFDRKHLLDLFKSSKLQAIVSVETLTTGFDAPNVDLIVLLRPTQSPVLHVQMLGRGMRPHIGKDRCMVLDFAGNVERLGPVDQVEIPLGKKKKKGKGKAVTKVCPDCNEIVHASHMICPSCGYKFPKKVNLVGVASNAPVMSGDKVEAKVVKRIVTDVSYSKHRKAGKPPSLKVTYRTNSFQFFSEWVALEHEGYPSVRAAKWWKARSLMTVPTTVDEALTRTTELRAPKAISILVTGKFPEIVAYHYENDKIPNRPA